MAWATTWTAEHFGRASSTLPFTFQYDGRASADLLDGWTRAADSEERDGPCTRRTLIWTDPATGLEVRCALIAYHDYPALEWMLWFRNVGPADSPVLSDILALDARLDVRPADGGFTLHHFAGGFAEASAYQPFASTIGPGDQRSFSATGGRPTNKEMPYFNLEGRGEGAIAVVGWPGQWSARFRNDEATGMRIAAGQERTHLRLHPGDEVRTPLIVLQFWKGGDWIDAQNVWRRWMKAHGMPMPGGALPEPRVHGSSYRVYGEMVNATEENQIAFIDRYQEEGIRIDYWWMDAGWYPCDENWGKVGTWEVDTARFPRGLRAISDHAHARGVGTMLWFEPERVAADTWLTANHPEWILGGAKGGLLNLGLPEARRWLTDHVDRVLTEQGIDVYRQDFNMDPLEFWQQHDAEDQQGITENKHVTGYLAYWDELIRRHPGMLIDTCASGGRRNDLETLRRAVPLWRTDYQYEPVGEQCQTYGISFWIPYHGGGNVADAGASYGGAGYTAVEPYAFWSTCYPSINCAVDMRVKGIGYPALRKLHDQRRQIVSLYYGDFYPLTPYSLENDVWMAWQFDQPELGTGMVQAFRRAGSDVGVRRLTLRGLDPEAHYALTPLDGPQLSPLSGRELLEEGLEVAIGDRPGAAVIAYGAGTT
jgi:alpha-galactosidase